jgi:molecular chaperone GrpE
MSNEKNGPVTQMAERFAELGRDAARFRDEYLRALADFDNYRRRVERDLAVSQRLVLECLMTDLLPVLDNFDRALATLAGVQDSGSLRQGVTLIHRQLCDALARHGLSQYSCAGRGFDPRRAEAVSFVETAEHPPNTVVQEVGKGYECEGRVLRPARVVVARQRPATEDAAQAGNAQIEPRAAPDQR